MVSRPMGSVRYSQDRLTGCALARRHAAPPKAMDMLVVFFMVVDEYYTISYGVGEEGRRGGELHPQEAFRSNENSMRNNSKWTRTALPGIFHPSEFLS